MATCLVEITADIASGAVLDYPIIATGVSIPFVFSPASKSKFVLTTSKQETIVCQLGVVNSGPVSVTFFKLNDGGKGVTSVGGVTTSDNSTSFQKDVTPGTYYICVSSSTVSSSGTFTCFFSGFVSQTRLLPKCYSGEVLISDLTIKKRERFCNEPMTFELISGELPPGCTLQPDGSIRGTLPDLDCIDLDEKAYSPSINWFFEDSEDRTHPIPRRWRFRARVTLVNYPYVYAEENFSIDVHNNWSKDRDAFMAKATDGFDRYTDIEVKTPVEKVDPNQIVKAIAVPSEVQPSNFIDCPSCGNADINRDAEFVSWYIYEYVESTNPQLEDFVDKFKSTNKFKEIARIYGEDTLTQEAINNIIINTIPTDGTRSPGDIDALFLSLGHKLNMKLPVEAIGHSGVTLTAKVE